MHHHVLTLVDNLMSVANGYRSAVRHSRGLTRQA